MKTDQTIKTSYAAHPIAAEDLRPGMYVALLQEILEFVIPSLCDPALNKGKTLEVKRAAFTPMPWDLAPLKVAGVCLPYVLARTPAGSLRTLDARQCRLALLPDGYGRKAFRMLKGKKPG